MQRCCSRCPGTVILLLFWGNLYQLLCGNTCLVQNCHPEVRNVVWSPDLLQSWWWQLKLSAWRFCNLLVMYWITIRGLVPFVTCWCDVGPCKLLQRGFLVNPSFLTCSLWSKSGRGLSHTVAVGWHGAVMSQCAQQLSQIVNVPLHRRMPGPHFTSASVEPHGFILWDLVRLRTASLFGFSTWWQHNVVCLQAWAAQDSCGCRSYQESSVEMQPP